MSIYTELHHTTIQFEKIIFCWRFIFFLFFSFFVIKYQKLCACFTLVVCNFFFYFVYEHFIFLWLWLQDFFSHKNTISNIHVHVPMFNLKWLLCKLWFGHRYSVKSNILFWIFINTYVMRWPISSFRKDIYHFVIP